MKEGMNFDPQFDEFIYSKSCRKYPLYNLQTIYKFPNGHGASIIHGEHTKGGDLGLYELATVSFDSDTCVMDIEYDGSYVAKIVGHLTSHEVNKILAEIMALDNKW